MAKKDVKKEAAQKVEDPKAPIPEPKQEPKITARGPVWVKVTADELAKAQAEGRLMGYNPEKGEALIK